MSQHPTLRFFVAADAIHNNNKAPVDWPSVDVIADRRGLRKLPTLAQPVGGKEVRDFGRIDVEVIGANLKTIVLTRWERRPSQPPAHGELWVPLWGRNGARCAGIPRLGHHRVITYVRCHCMQAYRRA